MFRQSALQNSQRRLYSQELFEFANVEPVRGEGQPAEIPTRVTVTEGKHKKVNFGVGYGSEEKARAEVDWRHVNFLGGARTFGVFARYSSLDRGVRLNFKEPYFFAPRYTLGLSGQSWHSDEPAFTLDTNGGRVTVTREFRRWGGARAQRAADDVGVADLRERARELPDLRGGARRSDVPRRPDRARPQSATPAAPAGRARPISVEFARNTDELAARRARRATCSSAHVEQAGKVLGGTFDYSEVTTEAPRLPDARRAGSSRPRRCALGSIDAFDGSGKRRAVLQAVLPGRRHEPARLGPLRGVAAVVTG